MGVPVVTLAGVNHAARVGVSILRNVRMTELIASNYNQYVEIAVNLALNRERLQQYRNSMRQRLLDSSLMDVDTFTLDLERAYRWMVERSCACPQDSK